MRQQLVIDIAKEAAALSEMSDVQRTLRGDVKHPCINSLAGSNSS